MIVTSLRRQNLLLTITALAVLGGANARAAGIPGGTIVAIFSSETTSGNVLNDPSAGLTTFLNNNSTATLGDNAGDGGQPTPTMPQELGWGHNSDFTAAGESTLTFQGATIASNQNLQVPFLLGTITYKNGTSDLNSLIFGASIGFYINGFQDFEALGADSIVINTTDDIFGVPGGLANGDDDYINICGNNSNICSNSIEAVEETEGGRGLTVDLYGTITGDPMLTITSVNVLDGETFLNNGFVGSDPALGVVPEPATWTMLAGALALAGLTRRRGKST
jgi:hypothetical protein